ncbi:MAG: ABC transporter substrate-binding protein [Parvibaculaceae bacterium]
MRAINRMFCLASMLAMMAAAHPAAAEDVNLGFMVGYTGDMGPWAPALDNAAKLAVEEINAAGGVLGNPIKLWSEDNESTVEGGVRGARKLVSVNKVNAIIGPESDVIMALKEFAKDNGIPIISTSAGTSALDRIGGAGRFLYRTNASDSFIGVAAAKLMLEALGHKEVAILVENVEGTQSTADAFIRNYEKFGGKISKKIVLSPGQATYHSELADLAGTKPKIVVLAAGQITGVNVVKQAYQRGYEWDWYATVELQNPDFVASAGAEVVKGTVSAVPGQRDDDPSWLRFSERYKAKYGEAPQTGFYQAETYDAIVLTALAMEAAKSTAGKDIDQHLTAVAAAPGEKVSTFEEGVKLLREGKDIDYSGASGTVDFNEFGNVGVPAIRLVKVNDKGEWETVQVVDSRDFPAN